MILNLYRQTYFLFCKTNLKILLDIYYTIVTTIERTKMITATACTLKTCGVIKCHAESKLTDTHQRLSKKVRKCRQGADSEVVLTAEPLSHLTGALAKGLSKLQLR